MQKLYDTKTLLETHQGDAEFIRYIVSLFIQHMPSMVEELKKARAQNDWQNLYFYAHKMKASIDLFAVKDLTATIRSIEQQGKAATGSESLSSDVEQVSNIITACIDQLKNEFKTSA